MNDRFKFRAWNKETKTMHYNAEQTYDCMTGCPLIYKSSFGDVLDDENYVVEQCIGLKDKNGKLIFEGDVVYHLRYDAPYSNKRKSKNIKCIVKWDDSRLRYYFDNIEKELDFIYFNINKPNDFEVIGNIYENLELLK